MKKLRLGAAVCLLAALGLIVLWRKPSFLSSPRPPLSPAPTVSALVPHSPAASSNSPPSATGTEDLASRAAEYKPETNTPIDLPPEIVLQNLRRAVHQYGEMFGGNPVGTNPEITAALAGQNPRHINFLAGQPGLRINPSGELIDTWGTPYFFHQLSGTVMEIHSAGPDKIMWTSDDLVTR